MINDSLTEIRLLNKMLTNLGLDSVDYANIEPFWVQLEESIKKGLNRAFYEGQKDGKAQVNEDTLTSL